MAFRVDHDRFVGVAAVVDWLTAQRAGAQPQNGKDVLATVEKRGLTSSDTIQLRWSFDAGLGYPLEPFTVWAKQATIPKDVVTFTTISTGTATQVFLVGTWVDVWVATSAGPGGLGFASAGMPLVAGVSAVADVGANAALTRFSAPAIRTLMLPSGTVVDEIRAHPSGIADDAAWQPVEIVGLPGDGRPASNTDLTTKQGLMTNLGAPVDAALDRFNRGAPMAGWGSEIRSGVAAPFWELADPVAIVKLFHAHMLDDFIAMVDAGSSSDQVTQLFQATLPTPSGKVATADFNPLLMLLLAGGTDPLAALVLGLGTAYVGVQPRGLGDHQPTHTHVVVDNAGRFLPDFMVTSTFADPLGRKVDRAALILGPRAQLPVLPVAALTATSQGYAAPERMDDPYRPVVSIGWQAPTDLIPFQSGSYALVREMLDPALGSVALMQPRPNDTALQPIGGTRNESDPRARSGSDTAYEVDATRTPNSLRYAVASQNVFGVWGPWASTGLSVSEPPPGTVPLQGPRLDIDSAPTTGPASATATIDLSWNWSSRSPQRLELVGRRYGQTWPSDPPANLSAPSGAGFASTGEGTLVTVTFGPGGHATVTAAAGLVATIGYLSVDGQSIEASPAQQRGIRRYRVRVSGIGLDFDASGHWGLAMWARGTEARAPQRVGAFNSSPSIASASDPRPPVITAVYDAVTMASLRDADGLHHAQLQWPAMAGAQGYYVYGCAESTFRAFHHLPEPSPTHTLASRMTVLRDAFAANPDRTPFTRLAAQPVTGTSMPITLPRGTKEIHLYLAIGASAGQVESAWPTLTDPQRRQRFIGFAAPQTVAPSPPELEVTRVLDPATTPPSYAARLRIRSAPGAQVVKLDVHRVRVADATADIGMMGPPLVTLTGSTADYTVTAIPDPGDGARSSVGVAQPLGIVVARDRPSGSWQPVFYRVAAWAGDDVDRGQYGVRSAASVTRSVVVPPAGPPDLTGPTLSYPGPGGSALVQIDTTTAEPLIASPLGLHRLEAEVLVTSGATPTPLALSAGSTSLDALADTAPTGSASGWWRGATTTVAGVKVTPLHLLVRRAASSDTLRVRLRMTDPLGRLTERIVAVPAGTPASLAPDVSGVVLTTVPGQGTILTFTTTAPNSTPEGPFVLHVRFVPAGRVRATVVKLELARLPWVPRSGTIFDAAYVIPISRTKRVAGVTTIAVGLRTAGTATVSIIAPDGTSTSITRAI